MDYKPQPSSIVGVKPRLIIHGGAGNITPANLPHERYLEYRHALLTILGETNSYMITPRPDLSSTGSKKSNLPTSLEVATYAVTLLENNPLFNSGHGAVFTRDGINELEASVMVSRGYKKRGIGVMGLRRVRNPILLARAILEHGEEDMGGASLESKGYIAEDNGSGAVDVPSAQGHTLLHTASAEVLATKYGLEMVKPSYFFTQNRWDEHIRSLEREKSGKGISTWSADEYLPQGTCGAVALDEDGVVCCATSTGGLTNKLTGRIGDTPVLGAGFWAEEWEEQGDPTGATTEERDAWDKMRDAISKPGAAVMVSDSLKGLLSDCLPTPFLYEPILQQSLDGQLSTTRSMGASGTGNGDAFLRIAAARTMAAMARWKPISNAEALRQVAGPEGELQKSAGNRWGKTGDGEGGIIGIECAIVRDGEGRLVGSRSEILHDHNCGGMFRAWIDEDAHAHMQLYRDQPSLSEAMRRLENQKEEISSWVSESDKV